MAVAWDRIPPPEDRGLPGKVRPFHRGVLLTIITLGLYSFWWHHRTHQELATFLRLPNPLHPIWMAHIAVVVFLVFFALFSVLPAAIEYEEQTGTFPFAQSGDDPPSARPIEGKGSDGSSNSALMDFLIKTGLFPVYAITILLSELTFILYVVLQHRALYQYTPQAPEWKGKALLFVVFWAISWTLSFWIPFSFLLMLIPYYSLQNAYNEFWQEFPPRPMPTPQPSAPGSGEQQDRFLPIDSISSQSPHIPQSPSTITTRFRLQ